MPDSTAARASLFPRIIGALIALLVMLGLGGCSAIKLGYNNAASLSYWWLDSYLDFNDDQTPAMRNSLDALHHWHRQQELPQYAELLRRLQGLAVQDITPEQACDVAQQAVLSVQRLAEQSAEGLSQFTPTVKPEQLKHLAHQIDKRNRKWREEWLDGTLEERRERRLKMGVERSEGFYGRLQPRQVELMKQLIASSNFDPQVNYRETLRRQQDLLQMLQEHSQNPARAAHVKAEVLAWLRRSLSQSPDTAYRAYFDQMLAESCRNFATLHNSTTPAQRQKALKALQGYETDVRTLIGQRP